MHYSLKRHKFQMKKGFSNAEIYLELEFNNPVWKKENRNHFLSVLYIWIHN